MTLRHRVEWNKTKNEVSWEKLEAELSNDTKLAILPGAISLDKEKPRSFQLRMALGKGSLETQPTLLPKDEFTAPIQFDIPPRDVEWKTPLIIGRGIGARGKAELDSQLAEPELRFLKALQLDHLEIAHLETGTYKIDNLTASGTWNLPAWKLDGFKVDVFEGTIQASGAGRWGTNDPVAVSLTLEGHGVALQPLLRSFKFKRAEQIQAKIGGALHLEAEGRNWKALELQIYGEEGTVFLDRQLLYDIPGLAQALTKERLDEALNAHYGTAKMIPFDEMTLDGNLANGKLNLRFPLVNKPLKLDYEQHIDSDLIWDIYDFLLDSGLENVRGKSGSVQHQKPAPRP